MWMSEVRFLDCQADVPYFHSTMRKKVFVSGCFDMLHSGHVAFLEEAATYGDLTVCLGSDENVRRLKGRFPVCKEEERQYMVRALRCVHDCIISKGWGILDFENDLRRIMPDMLIVNEDGNAPAKAQLCRELEIEYLVLRRVPRPGMPARSTTALRTECTIPYRIDLAGGWLDQPFVSKLAPGPVLTISIEPTLEFNDRSGMASSTRKRAVELWKTAIPPGDREQLAKILFSYDNPPGTESVSGSQDALGIVLPALNKLNYAGEYWPVSIDTVYDEETLSWIERHLALITLGPREQAFDVLAGKQITPSGAAALASATEQCWQAILAHDVRRFGTAFRAAFEAQVALFPRMLDGSIQSFIDQYRDTAYGWKLTGAGGGGYLVLVTDREIPGAIRITIRRPATI
jgi:cytidyltransferase-like protein